ncbi:helix-turn-helix transcriptional regulator [Cohnella laeviribosi]|uniref:helix-turn-helix transcriptional regulator n=1 Tax=Cohnella laeviribosi TaxID=380174 RepID=UPI000363DC4F|nr:WYL domain-containing protein [Cohnella laeviribosi]
MRADRLISILMHLQLKGRMTAKELSQLLEVSERTIYRDMDALSAAGVPIHADSGLGGGFTLSADYRAKVDGLNTSEIHALFMRMNEQPFKRLGFHYSLNSAFLKILNNLSDQHRMAAEWIRNRVFLDMEGWRGQQEKPDLMERVRQSVWEQRQAQMVYADRRHFKHELTLDPYGLVLKEGMWFLVGKADGNIRAFRMARIESFRLTENSFDRPDDFDLEAYWRLWTKEYVSRHARYSVVLQTDAETLPLICRMNGVLKVKVREDAEGAKDGRIEVQASFEHPDAAVSSVFSLAGRVDVIAPQELRDRICEQAARLVKQYSRT